jgi:TPP-dependent pyruvate/acetoin dehydrogenase alpha subunit
MDVLLKETDLINFEEKIAKLFNGKKILAPVHLYDGNERQLIEIFKQIEPQDWCVCTWRSLYQCLLKGLPEDVLTRAILEGRSIGLCFPEYKILSTGIVGGVFPIAVGLAWGAKLKGLNERVWVFGGETSFETGAAHEAIKYANNFDLPVKFVCEDNGKSVCTDTRTTWGSDVLSYEKNNCNKVIYYKYSTKWPHAGAGERVGF